MKKLITEFYSDDDVATVKVYMVKEYVTARTYWVIKKYIGSEYVGEEGHFSLNAAEDAAEDFVNQGY